MINFIVLIQIYFQSLFEKNHSPSGYTPSASGPGIPEISIAGTWSPVAIAVDWVGDKIYVVDAIGQKIDVIEWDGRYNAIVLSSNLTSPADIALDPKVG